MTWWQAFYADPDFIPAVNFPTPEKTEAEARFLDGLLRRCKERCILDLGCGYDCHTLPLMALAHQIR